MPCYFPFWMDNIPQPCGKCAYCINRRINNWVFRCMQEVRVSDSANWVTLTYEVPPLTDDNFMTLRKPDVQNFFKRLRKLPRAHSQKPIKYYLCGEYGDQFNRPHYHAVIFNSTCQDIQKTWQGFKNILDPEAVVLGICDFDEVNENTIAYTAKYMNKLKKIPLFFGDLRLPEFQLFSKGLGKSFITPEIIKYYNDDPTRNSITVNGFKKALPRYFADKIIVCPVLKLVKRLYAQEISNANLEAQFAEWNENKTVHQTFEQFRYQKKVAHNEYFTKKVLQRQKFK